LISVDLQDAVRKELIWSVTAHVSSFLIIDHVRKSGEHGKQASEHE